MDRVRVKVSIVVQLLKRAEAGPPAAVLKCVLILSFRHRLPRFCPVQSNHFELEGLQVTLEHSLHGLADVECKRKLDRSALYDHNSHNNAELR